jgi:hypothetical protein
MLGRMLMSLQFALEKSCAFGFSILINLLVPSIDASSPKRVSSGGVLATCFDLCLVSTENEFLIYPLACRNFVRSINDLELTNGRSTRGQCVRSAKVLRYASLH